MHLTVVKENDSEFVILFNDVARIVKNIPCPKHFSALQWNGSKGEIEYDDPNKIPNEKTEDLEWIENIIQIWKEHEPIVFYSKETLTVLEGIKKDKTPKGYTRTKNANFKKLELKEYLKIIRKELEEEGIELNGVKYSGSEKNRFSIDEAIVISNIEGFTHFENWLDDNEIFHSNHPVTEVVDARDKLLLRRSKLISHQRFLETLIDEEKIKTLEDLKNVDWPEKPQELK